VKLHGCKGLLQTPSSAARRRGRSTAQVDLTQAGLKIEIAEAKRGVNRRLARVDIKTEKDARRPNGWRA
jgi:hypothetical protein